MFVYISTYMHTETTCVWVYIYICVHQVYGYVCTPSLHVREHIFTYMHAEFTCVCICLHICTPSLHVCICIGVYAGRSVLSTICVTVNYFV